MSYFVTEGNVLTDATLRQTRAGNPVANAVIRVDSPVRHDDGTFGDGPTSDYEVTVFGKAAAPFAASARRGARIVAAGELVVEQYTEGEGTSRVRRRITADHHGVSSRYAPAVNTRRNGGQ
jgi:single-strand DNA-binding protein